MKTTTIRFNDQVFDQIVALQERYPISVNGLVCMAVSEMYHRMQSLAAQAQELPPRRTTDSAGTILEDFDVDLG